MVARIKMHEEQHILMLHRYALNYMFLGVICFLFRPSFNSTRFAYSELEGISSLKQFTLPTPCCWRNRQLHIMHQLSKAAGLRVITRVVDCSLLTAHCNLLSTSGPATSLYRIAHSSALVPLQVRMITSRWKRVG